MKWGTIISELYRANPTTKQTIEATPINLTSRKKKYPFTESRVMAWKLGENALVGILGTCLRISATKLIRTRAEEGNRTLNSAGFRTHASMIEADRREYGVERKPHRAVGRVDRRRSRRLRRPCSSPALPACLFFPLWSCLAPYAPIFIQSGVMRRRWCLCAWARGIKGILVT